MRRPSARCTPSTVTPVTQAWSVDAAGGRVRTPTSGTPIVCSVQPSSAADVPAHLREAQVIYHTVLCHDDPMLRVRDQLLWGASTLTVTGVAGDQAGQGRTWKVLCEERPS